MFKIFIVEDDTVIGSNLKSELEIWGYEAVLCTDFECVDEAFKLSRCHLILMDLVLPKKNGYEWCKEIRRFSNVPIIFISSKGETVNMVMAMEYGADDYIVKPMNYSVVLAKIGALIRRSYDFAGEMDIMSFGECNLDLGKSQITGAGGIAVSLTKTELAILTVLFKGRGSMVEREKIMSHCWAGDDFIDDNTLAVNITRLRKKLETIGCEGLIMTKKGLGYYLRRDGEER